MSLTDRKIDVAGGGVAGLAVARALAQRGAKVRLVERAPEITEVGAGIQISPNGMRVMDALGLGDALRAVSRPGKSVALRDGHTGRRIVRLDLEKAKGDFFFVHRARLIEVLAKGASDAGVEIVLGQELLPEASDADLILGADGWRSQFRAAMNPHETPFFTGQVAWRAMIPDDGYPEANVFMGPGRHLVSYPLAGGLRNIVAVEEREVWAEEGWFNRDDPGTVRTAFAEFGGPVPGWLAHLDEVHLWGLFRYPVAPKWHDGAKIAILGDAAHPTLPFLAQGANMALEDAWVLADCLEAMPQATALARCQELRQARTTRIVDAASANARNYHLRGITRLVAHTVLRFGGTMAPNAPLKRFSWLYDYDATQQVAK